jgi:SAM-dependent methyltransferase
MNWTYLRHCAWVDTRARFVATTPRGGALLDLGSSDGQTLNHMTELRPDLHFFAADLAGSPERYPVGCQFHRADFERDRLPWADGSMDAITCMHLVEHLRDLTHLMHEVARLLKPGGRVYFETPHPRTLTLPSARGRAAGTFTLNFYDDPTHVRLVEMDTLAEQGRRVGLEALGSGVSRSWVLAAAYPLFFFLPACRKKFIARVHWLGWSAYLIARRPAK